MRQVRRDPRLRSKRVQEVALVSRLRQCMVPFVRELAGEVKLACRRRQPDMQRVRGAYAGDRLR